jgi:predicted dehydrogenase
MYLRSDERELGKENFLAAIGSKPVRREFLDKGIRQGLNLRNGLGGHYFKYEKVTEPLRVGVIGAGEQGRRLIAAINPAYIAVKSVADLRPSNLRQAVTGNEVVPLTAEEKKEIDKLPLSAEEKKIKKAALKPDPKTGLVNVYKAKKEDFKTYATYKELLDKAKDDGLEAVIIALPSHLHAIVALAAMDAGLHVFTETPMALTVKDAKALARKAEDKKVCLAVGNQRRYSAMYDNALEMVRKGVLDDVHYIRAQWHLKDEKNPPVPKDDAAVKAKDHGYASVEELVYWRQWEKLSGGMIMDLGYHLFDAAAMIMAATPNRNPEQSYPLSVTATASQLSPHNEGDVDDHVYCVFEYPVKDYVEKGPQKTRKKVGLQYDLIVGNEFDGYGETVLGKVGSLVLDREQVGLLYRTSDTDKKTRVTLPARKDAAGKPLPEKIVLDVPKDAPRAGDEESAAIGQMAMFGTDPGFVAELEHWAFCVRNPESKPRCDALTGLAATVVAAAAVQAVKTGKRIDFQKEWFDPKSDAAPDAKDAKPA